MNMLLFNSKEHITTAFNVETPPAYQQKEMDSASPGTPSNVILGGVPL